MMTKRSIVATITNFKCKLCPTVYSEASLLTQHVHEFHNQSVSVLVEKIDFNKYVFQGKRSSSSSNENEQPEKKPRRSLRIQGVDVKSYAGGDVEVEQEEILISTGQSIKSKRAGFSAIQTDIPNDCLVFFDLETGGMSNEDEILEIAAMYQDQQFNVYCLPTKKISPFATRVNKLSFKNGSLHYKGVRVNAVPVRQGLQNFYNFLQKLPQSGKLVLVAHNVKFDSRMLLNGLARCQMHKELEKYVLGFLDTVPMYKRFYPTCLSFKQSTLVQTFMEKASRSADYNAHNAMSDVVYMVKMFDLKLKPKLTPALTKDFSYTLTSAINKNSVIERMEKKPALPSMEVTVEEIKILAEFNMKPVVTDKEKNEMEAHKAINRIVRHYKKRKV
ncbi:hypothetical protein HDE_06306 [Halotydeus destructor]|nr:hypothetical protein HDE_06306 [Halotydeus destructor]